MKSKGQDEKMAKTNLCERTDQEIYRSSAIQIQGFDFLIAGDDCTVREHWVRDR